MRARRGRRRARSSCCRRSGACSAAARTCAPAPSRSTAPAITLGARRSRASSAIDLVAGSISERVDGRGQAAQHLASTSAPTARSTPTYRKIHLFDVEVDGTRLPRVRPRGARRRGRAQRDRRRRRARPDRLLRPALPRALPRCSRSTARGSSPSRPPSRCRRRATTGRCCVRARAIENQCFVVAANQIGEHARGPPVRRALDDRRPVGPRARRRPPDARDRDHRRPRPRRARTRIRARLPSLANRRPDGLPLAGRPDGRAQREAGRREAPPDPRRGGPRLRPPGLQHLPRVATSPTRRASPTASSTTTSAPRTRCSTRSSSSAGTSCSTRSARSTRQDIAGARQALRDRVVHRRLLPPRPRPDEGHHRRGHARGELVRAAPTWRRSARPTS